MGSGRRGTGVATAGHRRQLSIAGNAIASRIAAYDPVSGQWSSLGSGVSGGLNSVDSLTTAPNGDLVAGGHFSIADGLPASNIARWNGTSWSPLGSGTNGHVLALTALPNGDVVAGGSFTVAGGVAVASLARWDGTSWFPLGGVGGNPDARVAALTTMANGDVVAAGYFPTMGGLAVNNIARWNGSSWSPMGYGLTGGLSEGVRVLMTMPNGDLVAGGWISSTSTMPVNNIARWDGTAWSPLGPGFNNRVLALTSLPNGDVVAGGQFFQTGSGVPITRVARWDGTAWSSLGISLGAIHSLTTMPSGDVVAGGSFTEPAAGGTLATNLASWDGTAWSALSSGTIGSQVAASMTLPNGDIVIGGQDGIRRWNGANWVPIASVNAYALAALPNGDLVAGGEFSSVNGVPANNIATWNGLTWAPLGAGANSRVRAIATTATGNIIAGGDFTSAGGTPANFIAQWDGTTWAPLGTGMSVPPPTWPNPTLPAAVRALATMPNGDIIAGGDFTSAGGVLAHAVARWDGASWFALGAGMYGGPVYSLATMPNGDLIAGGLFTYAGLMPANRVARWNGSAWSSFGSGTWSSYSVVRALAAMPDGDLVAGGTFTTADGVPANNIARWDGAAWSPIGNGLNGPVNCVARAANGDLVAGGSFVTAGDAVSVYVARLTSTCPATTTSLGGGCPSSGGNNSLTATLPWAGSTWQATGTGLPSSAIVLQVFGFSTVALPLAGILSQGAPGCTLMANPDIVDLSLSSNGTAQAQLTIPDNTALAGVAFYAQMVPLETDPLLGILSATSTDALAMTVGVF